jgi:sulfur-carrier protein adenylyltransferase/sulfurtransferase
VFENLTPKDLRRYAFQISLPEVGMEGQANLKKSKVLVVGAGSKGSAILQNLAASGIGFIGICDNAQVQDNLLCKQHLFGNNDLGKQKAIIAKQKLNEINNLVDCELHNVFLNEKNIDIICRDYDAIIDTTDNFPCHYLIDDAAIKHGKINVFGSVFKNNVIASIFNYHEGPSFRCLFASRPDYTEEPLGYICFSSLTDILGAIIVNETCKVLLGQDSKLNGHLMNFDASIFSFSFEPISKKPDNIH